jgi:hypothetical protein
MDSPQPPVSRGGLSTGQIVILAMLLSIGFGVVAVTGYFRLGSDTAALRSSVSESISEQLHKKIAVHVGALTINALRIGLRWVHLPPEPRAALNALQGAEVGVYNLQQHATSFNFSKIVARADKAMTRRGWDRAVGMVNKHDLVVIYVPHKPTPRAKMKCCLMVLHEKILVVGSAHGNVEPLMEIARDRIHLHSEENHFVLR